jgi:hypothetical protein
MPSERSAGPEAIGSASSQRTGGTPQPDLKLLDMTWMATPKGFFDRDISICITQTTLNRTDKDILLNYWVHTLNRTFGQATGLSFSGWQSCGKPGVGRPNTVNLGVSTIPEPYCSAGGSGSTQIDTVVFQHSKLGCSLG